MVITEAAAGNDSVVGLVYVAAFAPEQGESALQLSTMFPGSTLGDALTAYPVSTGGNEFAIRPDLFHHQFAADVPAEQAATHGRHPATGDPGRARPTASPTDRPAWKDLPSWFVYGDSRPQHPRRAAALHRRAGRLPQGTREIAGASHAISVSDPDAVASTILDAVRATTAAVVAA